MALKTLEAFSPEASEPDEDILPDILAPGLDVIFVGAAPSRSSADIGHYYAGPTNKFWRLLSQAGFTPRLLRSEEDAEVLRYGVGLTGIYKHLSTSANHLLPAPTATLSFFSRKRPRGGAGVSVRRYAVRSRSCAVDSLGPCSVVSTDLRTCDSSVFTAPFQPHGPVSFTPSNVNTRLGVPCDPSPRVSASWPLAWPSVWQLWQLNHPS